MARRVQLDKAKRERVYKRDNYKCARCGSKRNLTLDHAVPISKGGSPRRVENLQTLCLFCNSQKDNTIACYTQHKVVRHYVSTFVKELKEKDNERRDVDAGNLVSADIANSSGVEEDVPR